MDFNVGLGIDVGGTNTDAVLIDLLSKEILSFAKA
jgi:N-methylhydantoinase A/oxoprolinase/acetone carboxylase beta subunit